MRQGTLVSIVLILMAAPCLGQAEGAYPGAAWLESTPAAVGLDAAKLEAARDYALTGGGSGYITRHGRLVLHWGGLDERYDLKSSTKSIGVTALGLALGDGKVKLDDPAQKYQPELGIAPDNPEVTKANQDSGWLGEITLHHLATQTAGFEKPGGYGKLQFAPGTQWFYSDAGPNWLAECLTLAYKKDMNTLLFERIFTPIGITPNDLVWRKNQYRAAEIEGMQRCEFGSGIRAGVGAMARIGYLYLRDGAWNGEQLLPASFVAMARVPDPLARDKPVFEGDPHGNASDHYGLLWWNNGDGTLPEVPRDAYWSWGLYDSLIVVIPSLDIVAARAGKSWARQEGWGHYEVLAPFLNPIAGAVQAPHPPSPVLSGLAWGPADSVTHAAEGSDNWPMTWADDGKLYTAYGDGWGFEPKLKDKLSLGLAAISGGPDDFIAENIRSADAEATGNDVRGHKASGMLMADGVLYMLARNTNNARLAWSNDHGRTWTWAAWRFTESFGCPCFLNFGQNYAGARDEYVYVYSQDQDSAYEAADGVVLARVPKDKIREQSAYRYFAGIEAGQPVWSAQVGNRKAAFAFPGRAYRTQASYDPINKRYLLVQTLAKAERTQAGGFGIYDAPEPWGPWTTVFFTEQWDADPGDTASLPPKWMAPDGRSYTLVCSGEDSFAVRKLHLFPK